MDLLLILTYVALPDPCPARGQPLAGGDDELARGEEPTTPTPTSIATGAVIAHACRHLAFLRRTDALIARQATSQPGLWCLLDAFDPGVAGRIASLDAEPTRDAYGGVPVHVVANG